jgi:hypothetical protein
MADVVANLFGRRRRVLQKILSRLMFWVVLIAAVIVSAAAAMQVAGLIRASGVELTVGVALSLWAVWFYLGQWH